MRRVRRRRWWVAAIALAGALPCALTALWTPSAKLILNVSASSPRGLYLVAGHQPLRHGDWAIARPSPAVAALAAERRYLPYGVPLVKRVFAIAGDRICAVGDTVEVNGRRVAQRQQVDGRGRALPTWTGCHTLASGEVLLLGDGSWSFDGRYFGITRGADVIGRAELWWRA